MSRWLFPWSGSIKKRACRYLLQHYLGHFLQERLSLDQLSLDLYNGSGDITNINLDVWVSSREGSSRRPVLLWDACTLDCVATALPSSTTISNVMFLAWLLFLRGNAIRRNATPPLRISVIFYFPRWMYLPHAQQMSIANLRRHFFLFVCPYHILVCCFFFI